MTFTPSEVVLWIEDERNLTIQADTKEDAVGCVRLFQALYLFDFNPGDIQVVTEGDDEMFIVEISEDFHGLEERIGGDDGVAFNWFNEMIGEDNFKPDEVCVHLKDEEDAIMISAHSVGDIIGCATLLQRTYGFTYSEDDIAGPDDSNVYYLQIHDDFHNLDSIVPGIVPDGEAFIKWFDALIQ